VTTFRKTESVEHEQELSRLQAEVDALRTQLRSSQRLATLGTMTAMIAHEFNNILTPIMNCAQMARMNPELMDKAINRAAHGGQRAEKICRAILGVAGEDHEGPEEVNVSALISETIAAMAREPARDGIELILEAPPELAVLTRRVELQQVLLNLIINARAAVMDKSAPRRIEISARRAGDDTIIHVRDNGVGIAPENIERIFQPFFSTKPKPAAGSDAGGHGLGLAVCREIINGLGGDIDVAGEVGVGATFVLRLPPEPPPAKRLAIATTGEPAAV